VVGMCKHDNERSGFIGGGEFLTWISDYYVLKVSAL
jgi:hypothetical protein